MSAVKLWAAALVMLLPRAAWADWNLKPFAGVTFGGQTTFIVAVPKPHPVLGVSGVYLGNVLGVEGDFALVPGFFGHQEVLQQDLLQQGSRVTTLTGNLIVAVPKRLAEYTLRPYFVAGLGLMHVTAPGRLGGVNISSTLPATDLGGGVTGFFNDRLGVSWDVRRFQSFNGQLHGNSFADEALSFWRATMALTIRYGK